MRSASGARDAPDTRRDYSPTSTPSRPSQAGPRPLRSRRILYIFSGPARPFDGLAAIAALVGVGVDEVDTLHGGSAHDVLRATTRERYLDAVRSGAYCAAIIATPCSTWYQNLRVLSAQRTGGNGGNSDGGNSDEGGATPMPDAPTARDVSTSGSITEGDSKILACLRATYPLIDLGRTVSRRRGPQPQRWT